MSTVQTTRPNRFAVGITAFAAIMMMTVGVFQAIQGIVALFNDTFYVVGQKWTFSFDITTWGWIQLILGVLVGLTGLGLLAGNEVARVLGIALLAINAVMQIVWFSAAPLWAFLMIILDVVIIYQLMVNWTEPEVRR